MHTWGHTVRWRLVRERVHGPGVMFLLQSMVGAGFLCVHYLWLNLKHQSKVEGCSRG